MAKPTIEEKLQFILDNELTMSRQLALHLLDKPVPPIWMIFIPIFFVFYAWKLKQYSRGLADFSDQYMIARQQALEETAAAERDNRPTDCDRLLEHAGPLPDAATPMYLEWMRLLTDHYQALLSTSGTSYPELVRAAYRTKSNYLMVCNRLAKAENAFATELTPQIQEDASALQDIIDKMGRLANDLNRAECDKIFP